MTTEEGTFLALLGHVFLQNARPDKAAVLFAALDRLAPGQPKVLGSLALAQLRSNKAERALNTLDRLAMTGTIDATFHLLRARALTALNRNDESQAAMRAYLSIKDQIPAFTTAGQDA